MTDRSPIRNTDAGARLLVDLRSEIARADSKASVLVAALGMTAGVISGWLAGSGWRPSALSAPARPCGGRAPADWRPRCSPC